MERREDTHKKMVKYKFKKNQRQKELGKAPASEGLTGVVLSDYSKWGKKLEDEEALTSDSEGELLGRHDDSDLDDLDDDFGGGRGGGKTGKTSPTKKGSGGAGGEKKKFSQMVKGEPMDDEETSRNPFAKDTATLAGKDNGLLALANGSDGLGAIPEGDDDDDVDMLEGEFDEEGDDDWADAEDEAAKA